MSEMSKRERLEATFRGQPVDRVAVALWRHWPVDDQRAEDLARSTIAFQREFDFDFIKVTPSSDFCLEDWGTESVWLGDTEGTRQYIRYPVHSPSDWEKLSVLDPDKGGLGRQVRCLELIGREVGDEVPFIQTIFSPLAQAKNLIGERLLVHMRQYPDALHAGLETITRTTIRFIEAIKPTGIAGIFYAIQHASYQLLSEQEYRTFGRPYDLRILEAVQDCWFNLLHLHGTDVMFDLCRDYPVQAINWHDQETPPSLREALGRFPGAVLGGINRVETLVRGEPDEVSAEVRAAISQTGGMRFIVGTGCVTPIVAPIANIRAARQAVERG
jgi:uroporphyrinogen decarboxylase